MKAFILTLVILVTIGNCQARTFGCFMGVLEAKSSQSLDIVYNNHDIFYHKKRSTDLLPFLGCGISFDF